MSGSSYMLVDLMIKSIVYVKYIKPMKSEK